MFGRNKAKIHDQALILLHEWNMIFSSAGKCLEANDEVYEEENEARLALNLEINILGILVYIVAGIGHPATGTEMIEQFKELFLQSRDEMRLSYLSAKDAGELVNGVYQQARSLSDSYMAQGKGLDDIIDGFAVITLRNCGLEATDNNLGFFKNAYSIFYKETLEKYSSDFSSLLGDKKTETLENEINLEEEIQDSSIINMRETATQLDEDVYELYIQEREKTEVADQVSKDAKADIPVDALRTLKELYDAGIFTEKEFTEKKRQLLGI